METIYRKSSEHSSSSSSKIEAPVAGDKESRAPEGANSRDYFLQMLVKHEQFAGNDCVNIFRNCHWCNCSRYTANVYYLLIFFSLYLYRLRFFLSYLN